MQFAEILDRFDAVSEEADGGYLARCASHGDSRPSLRIWLGDDGRVRMTCRAGCETKDVIAAAGLAWKDMFDATGDGPTVPRERPAMVGVAHVAALRVWLDWLPLDDESTTYARERFGLDADTLFQLGVRTYRPDSEHGFTHISTAFARYPRLVVPLNGFDGVARGAQGRDLSGECPGRWLSLSNPQGHRWAPYGVFRAPEASGTTLICEGPGDALTAVGAGFDAVAIRGAALASSPELISELADGLRGQRVVAAGDNDDAGRAFNGRLARGLAEHGIDVHTLALPDGTGDLSDWYADLRTAFAEVLGEAVEAARPVLLPDARSADVAPAEITADEWAQIADSLERGPDKLVPHVNYATLVRRVAGDVIMHVTGVGWYQWDGVRWAVSDDSGAAYRALTATANALAAYQAAAPRGASWVDEARAVLLNSQHRNHIVAELGRLPEVQADADALDAHRHLLNFPNGTVDLRTGVLSAHDPANRLTHVANVDYARDARSPRWDQFLEEVFPGAPDVQAYYQRFLGMCLSGEVRDHKLGVWYGPHGRNGKGATVRTLQAVFGSDLVHEIPFAVFENVREGGNPEQAIAQMRGARMVVAQEGSADAPIKTHLLKNWSGGDRLTGRHLYQMPFTYTPQMTLVLATNHLPQFSSGGAALWARTDALLFGESFAGREDPTLEPTVQGPEAPGVAAWVVAGAIAYYTDGLRSPHAVREATERHKQEVDPLRPLVGEVFEYRDDMHAVRGDFNAALKDWRDINGDRSGKYSPGTVKRALLQRGVEEIRLPGGKWAYSGVGLVSEIAERAQSAGPGIFARDEN